MVNSCRGQVADESEGSAADCATSLRKRSRSSSSVAWGGGGFIGNGRGFRDHGEGSKAPARLAQKRRGCPRRGNSYWGL